MRSILALVLLGAASSAQAFSAPKLKDFTTALAERMALLSPSELSRFHKEIARSAGIAARDEDMDSMLGELDARSMTDNMVGMTERAADQPELEEPVMKTKEKRQALACSYIRQAPLWYLQNPGNCLTQTPSANIDDPINGLQVGTVNNWDGGRIPPSLRGIFYMEGNPYKSECFSTGTGYINTTTGSLETPMWAPKTWSSDPGSGQLASAVYYGSTFQTKCTPNAAGLLQCQSQQWNRRTNEISFAGDYTANEVGPNTWVRGSDIKGIQLSKNPPTYARYTYNMYRIVAENGQRTDLFAKRYLPNIGKTMGTTGQWFVHLQATQEVPQRR